MHTLTWILTVHYFYFSWDPCVQTTIPDRNWTTLQSSSNSRRWWRTGKPGMLQSMGVTKCWTQLSGWIITIHQNVKRRPNIKYSVTCRQFQKCLGQKLKKKKREREVERGFVVLVYISRCFRRWRSFNYVLHGVGDWLLWITFYALGPSLLFCSLLQSCPPWILPSPLLLPLSPHHWWLQSS